MSDRDRTVHATASTSGTGVGAFLESQFRRHPGYETGALDAVKAEWEPPQLGYWRSATADDVGWMFGNPTIVSLPILIEDILKEIQNATANLNLLVHVAVHPRPQRSEPQTDRLRRLV